MKDRHPGRWWGDNSSLPPLSSHCFVGSSKQRHEVGVITAALSSSFVLFRCHPEAQSGHFAQGSQAQLLSEHFGVTVTSSWAVPTAGHRVCAEGLEVCHLLPGPPSTPGLFWVTGTAHRLLLSPVFWPHGACPRVMWICSPYPTPHTRLPFLVWGSRCCLQAQAAEPGQEGAASVTFISTSLPPEP